MAVEPYEAEQQSPTVMASAAPSKKPRWAALCASVPGFTPLQPQSVVLAGARDVDAGERRRLDGSEPRRARAARNGGRLAETLAPAERVSLHIDLDVLDPVHGHANQYAVPPASARKSSSAPCAPSRLGRGSQRSLILSAYDPRSTREAVSAKRRSRPFGSSPDARSVVRRAIA